MVYKNQAIRLFNNNLLSASRNSDETIATLTQLIQNEWYWGAYQGEGMGLDNHLRLLKNMVRLRGGFCRLGLQGLIAKLAITTDVSIALSCQSPPLLQFGQRVEALERPTQTGLRPALHTPLVSSLVSFKHIAEALGIHKYTAAILDDVRCLIERVLELPATPTPKELLRIRQTAEWVYDRLSRLPDSLRAPLAPPPVATRSIANIDQMPTAGRNEASVQDPANYIHSTYSTGTAAWLQPEFSDPAAALSHPQSTFSYPVQASSDGARRFSGPTPASNHTALAFRPAFRPASGHPEPAFSEPGQHDVLRSEIMPGSETIPGSANLAFTNPDGPALSSAPLSPDDSTDFTHQSVRLAGIIYSKAIMQRRPFTMVVTPAECVQLWDTVCRVPMSTWKGALGVFSWTIMCILPVAVWSEQCHTVDALIVQKVKRKLESSLFQIGMENWELARETMEAGLMLQKWLVEGATDGTGVSE